MNGIDHYTGFIIAGIILNITPGADTIYILSRSIAQGRKAGILSVLGISSGGVIHTCAAALGLSLLLAESKTAFTAVTWLGAGYLIYMGIRTIAQKNHPASGLSVFSEREKHLTIYRQGLITNLFNPKVALFFISFLPQFIKPSEAASPVPFLILGATFLFTGTVWCLFLAFSAAAVSSKLRKNPRTAFLLQKICGLIFIGLGLKLVLIK